MNFLNVPYENLLNTCDVIFIEDTKDSMNMLQHIPQDWKTYAV